ncbi:MAG: hypothetical protein IKN97_00145, partial [Lachnospiraceae bacterium]|nr:hypothetical protein [Lachnospiraceae bacterium]
MKILAIDSSGLVASAAIWEGASAAVTGTILATASTDYKKTHSQTLLPMIDRICKETDSDPKSFDAVAVAAGPGSANVLGGTFLAVKLYGKTVE